MDNLVRGPDATSPPRRRPGSGAACSESPAQRASTDGTTSVATDGVLVLPRPQQQGDPTWAAAAAATADGATASATVAPPPAFADASPLQPSALLPLPLPHHTSSSPLPSSFLTSDPSSALRQSLHDGLTPPLAVSNSSSSAAVAAAVASQSTPLSLAHIASTCSHSTSLNQLILDDHPAAWNRPPLIDTCGPGIPSQPSSELQLPLLLNDALPFPVPTGSLTSWPAALPDDDSFVLAPLPNSTPLQAATFPTLESSSSCCSLYSDSDTDYCDTLASISSFDGGLRTAINTTTSRGSTLPPFTRKPTKRKSPHTNTSSFFSSSLAKHRGSMSVRPMTKRPGDGSDPLSLGDDSGYSLSNHPSADSKLKLPRIERGQDDFSTVVKNRLQSYTRTGQACDRCKVRKIRCDALPEGCSHCINLSLECYVTDRVTGRTERRGYMQELEREKNGMVSHIRDLERLLRENGIEVKPFKEVSTEDSYDPLPSGGSSRSSLSDFVQVGSLWVKNYPEKANYTPSFPRSQLEVDDTRPQPNAPLSTVRGTKLSILGTTIDTTSFEAPDVDEPPDGTPIDTPIYNKSVQAFLQSSMRVQPPMQVPMPSREDAFNYATWYFSTVAAFLPLLHQPSFMSLLTRMYDDPQFKPTAPEIVMVHMVFASILFNIGLRNEHRKQLNDLSNRHYHYALSLMYELQISKELAAVQALALIASHTRSFPKPGAGSIVAHLALQRAIDLNLHRAWKSPDEGTNLTNELRKRTFWTILMVVVAITGRRGLPIPISVEEFDVGLPEPIADELLTEDGVDTSRTLPCPYEAGIAGIKITTIFMEIYSNMYSVRRDPNNYTNIVKALEKQLHQWEEDLPAALRKVAGEDINLAALYMRGFYLEARLSLRHPSVAMTKDKKMLADNTRVCEEIGREFLQITKQIDKMRSLDTTWYSMSVYATCIFCMLVAHWERRFQTTPEKVQQLRTDMEDWMGVLRSISYLLGSGPGIASEIYKIMNRTINWIEHDMKRTDKVKRPATESPVPIMVKTEYPPVQRSPPKSNVSHHRPRPQQQAPMPQVPPVQQLQLQQPPPPQQQQQQQQPQPQPQLHPSQHHHPHMQAATQTQPSPPMHNQQHQHQHQHQHQQPPLPPQMQQQQSHVDRVSPEAGGVHGSASPENANASTYYANGDPSQTNYVAMGYNTTAGQQQIVPATSAYQPQAQMYYATTAQVPNGTVQDTAGQVISFGSHPSAITSADFLWQARGTTWQDWTQAIADPDERYNANALIDIGGSAPQSRLNVDNSMLQSDPTSMPQSHPEMTATHMQPWPMAIFGHGGATGS